MLGVPDAFELPRAPGHGFLQVRRRSRWPGSGPRTCPGCTARTGRHVGPVASSGEHAGCCSEYATAYVAPPVDGRADGAVAETEDDDAVGESLLDILVDRLEGQGTPAHQVWLPPLDEPPTLDELLADAGRRSGARADRRPTGHGRCAACRCWASSTGRCEQRRDPLVLDLSGAGRARR